MSKMCVTRLIIVTSFYLILLTWQHTPLCAAYQFFILGKNGDYKYGYRTDNGVVVRQEADRTNQVSGQYFYKNDLGNFGLSYSSGVQGYSPQILDPNDLTLVNSNPQVSTPYQFSFDTGNYRRQESLDTEGNIRGHFEYNAGHHDLTYVANDEAGYKTTGGNLATFIPVYWFPVVAEQNSPSQFKYDGSSVNSNQHDPKKYQSSVSGSFAFPFNSVWDYQSQLSSNVNQQFFLTPYYLIDLPDYFGYWPYYSGADRSYNFSFNTGNYRKEESSDSSGNISGYFEYEDNAGYHNLSYISSDKAGFQVTGGNLAAHYPLNNDNKPVNPSSRNPYASMNDASGQLEYPFNDNKNSGNQHLMRNLKRHLQDLSKYLNDFLNSLYELPYTERGNRYYYFLFDTGKYKIEEHFNQSGNITGYFQFEDGSGYHDLSYFMDDKTGFQAVGGNLAASVPKDFSTFTTIKPAEYGSNSRDQSDCDNKDNEEEIIFLVGNSTDSFEYTK